MAAGTRILMVGLMAMLGLFAENRAALAEGARINVILRNDARLEGQILANAKACVTRVFASAGVDVRWKRESHLGDHLMVIILPRDGSERLNRASKTMGFAPRDANGERGRVAYVFAHRVREAGRDQAGMAMVLGIATAHELGHLLLPVNSHSDGGIMRADWIERDFADARKGALLFTPDQAAQVRDGLAGSPLLGPLAMAR